MTFRHRESRLRAWLFLACSLTAFPAHAADGRIPVSDPITITQPGHYYLTRDLTTAYPLNDCQICIHASDVTLDLGGHRMVAAAGNSNGVLAENGPWGTPENLEVTNGRLSGFSYGVHVDESATARNFSFSHLVFTEGVYGVVLGGFGTNNFRINVRIRDNQVALTGPNSTFGRGIYCGNCISGEISGNIVNGDQDDVGIYIVSSRGLLIQQNQVMNSNYGLNATCVGCSIVNNTLTNNHFGFRLLSSGDRNRVIGNAVSHEAPPADGYCLQVESVNNVIDDNLFAKCGNYGLNLVSAGNVYSRNRSLGNGINYTVAASNIDGGGNL